MLKVPSTPQVNKKFDKGSVIIREGEAGAEMYIIIQGSAEVFQNYQKLEEQRLGEISHGDFFGEEALFLNRRYGVSVIAREEVTVTVVGRSSASELFSRQPELAYSTIEKLVKRCDALHQSNEKLLSEIKLLKPEEKQSGPSQSSELFPPGHGSYVLNLSNNNATSVYGMKCTCPLCGQMFESLCVLTSRLRSVGTDRDLRTRYADVEPMHYDIISCPTCLYSAPYEMFPEASKKLSERVWQELGDFHGKVNILTGRDRDTFTVFAGYYLALRCVYICFDDPHLAIAGMWQKLSRLYKDCEDENMHLHASANALKEYDYIYGHANLSDKQMQQICIILGDLHERLGNIDMAKTFFFKAKSINNASSAMRLQADRRLEELRAVK